MKILSGLHKGFTIPSPKTTHVRPTQEKVRAQIFNICQADIEGADILDLFAGTGSLGFEAISRGAAHCTFVEKDRFQADLIRQVADQWHADIDVLTLDARRALTLLDKRKRQFSICLLDPPYTQTDERNGQMIAETLLALERSSCLADGCRVFLEDSFKSAADTVALQHLKLIDTRRSGSTALRQFIFYKDLP